MGKYGAFYYARSTLERGDAFLTFKVYGQSVKARKERNESLIQFFDETEQELATLDMAAWLSEQNPDEMNRADGSYQRKSQEFLSIDVDLKSIGTIQLVARRLSFSKRQGEWYFSSGEFWVLVPGS